jgi:GNAT superfamily N-acetyltransferase
MPSPPINPVLTWRPLLPSDIPSLTHIASIIHPSLPERPAVFAERIDLFPAGCFALVHNTTHRLCGYAISHPIRHRQPPALDSLLGEIAKDAEMYYIHDIAILPDFKGQGYARVCVDKIGEVARGYEMTGLVSVYGTRGFWGRFGFAEIVGDEGMRVKMVEYGEDAVWLERRNEG